MQQQLSASVEPMTVAQFSRPAARRLETLRQERAFLEEEIRQLRAAVQMYAEVARRLAHATR